MGRISLAWQVLTNGVFAAKVASLLDVRKELSAPTMVAVEPPKSAPPMRPMRSDAISLLAALQREGRFIDFLKEAIESYSDAQVGAAVRDIHRDCGSVLERQFAIRPVLDQTEGSPVRLENPLNPGRIKLSGKAGDNSPTSGLLVHHGWQATKCDVPTWTGDKESSSIIAPAEVEVR